MKFPLSFWLARIVAYGALPGFLYLALAVAAGAGDPAMLWPAVYIGIGAGWLITDRVVKRKIRAGEHRE